MISAHSHRLERWLGAETVAGVSRSMRGWYGPPIAIAGVPGAVYATSDGDFIGTIRAGQHAEWRDYAGDWIKRLGRGIRRASISNRSKLNALTSVSDIIAEAAAGKKRDFTYYKVGSAGATAGSNSLWRAGPLPPAGEAPGAAPGGTAFTDASTGGMPFVNPTGGDTQHLVSASTVTSTAGSTLLLYDLLFGVDKTMNSTSDEAVTGVPTRYQSTTPGAANSAEGNFLFVQVGGTALAATAHAWDNCTYLDQAGSTSALPTITGVASAVVDRFDDATTSRWFAPLEAGDRGIQALTNIHCSAAVATGVVWFMIGHPLAFFPHPLANMFCQYDGILTSFNLTRIFDDACLSFLEANKVSSGASTYSGIITTVSG